MDVMQQLIAVVDQLDAIASTADLSFEVLNDLDEARFFIRRMIAKIEQEQQQ